MTVDKLYGEVTEAILLAEGYEADGRATEAADAYFRVSSLEEEIADQIPAHDEEGAIARRGVVTAALSAGVPARALEMAERYIAEKDAPGELVQQLRELAAEARQAIPKRSDPQIRPLARFRIRRPAA